MSFCILCSFEATSDENLKMHIQKEHDPAVESETLFCRRRLEGLSGTFLLDRRELAFFSAGCSYSGNYEQC